MSQQKSAEDTIIEAGCNIFMLLVYGLWAIVASVITLISKSVRQSPEEQLRQTGKSNE